jgi:hypothetical protein
MCPESEPTAHPRSDVMVSRYQALLEMADTLAHQGALPDLLRELATRLTNVVAFDFINFSLYDEFRNKMLLNLWQGPDSLLCLWNLKLISHSPDGCGRTRSRLSGRKPSTDPASPSCSICSALAVWVLTVLCRLVPHSVSWAPSDSARSSRMLLARMNLTSYRGSRFSSPCPWITTLPARP